jgi:hypothetical protein
MNDGIDCPTPQLQSALTSERMEEELAQLHQRRRLEADIRSTEAPLMSGASIRRLQERERQRLEEDQAALRLESALNAADAKRERKQKRVKALVEQGRREGLQHLEERLQAQKWHFMAFLSLLAVGYQIEGVPAADLLCAMTMVSLFAMFVLE